MSAPQTQTGGGSGTGLLERPIFGGIPSCPSCGHDKHVNPCKHPMTVIAWSGVRTRECQCLFGVFE